MRKTVFGSHRLKGTQSYGKIGKPSQTALRTRQQEKLWEKTLQEILEKADEKKLTDEIRKLLDKKDFLPTKVEQELLSFWRKKDLQMKGVKEQTIKLIIEANQALIRRKANL